MPYRAISADRICVTQPTHAWVAGQLAQAGGNETLSSFSAMRQQLASAPWVMLPATLHPGTEPSLSNSSSL